MDLIRHRSFRFWFIIALIALLCGGLFLFGGNAPALLVALFTFGAWLIVSAWLGCRNKLLFISSPVKTERPSRAPPSFSFQSH